MKKLKKLIVNLAWNLINWLDPIKIKKFTVDYDGITVKFERELLNDKWTKVDATVSMWARRQGKNISMADIQVFKNGELYYKYNL